MTPPVSSPGAPAPVVVEIVARFGDRVVYVRHLEGDRYVVGEGPEADLPVQLPPSASSGAVVPTALVIDARGARLGFQDKVQLDPSEDDTYAPGHERQLFQLDGLAFGVDLPRGLALSRDRALRGAPRRPRGVSPALPPRGARRVPPDDVRRSGQHLPREGRAVPRAENTCYFASVNYASAGSATTSAIANPDGTLLAYQPYGEAGLLVADLDLALATGLLARRCKS